MTRIFAAISFVAALSVGGRAPDFALPDQNKKIVRLADARGHKAVVVFYRGYW